MNRKEMILDVCLYVVGGGIEKENVINEMYYSISDWEPNKKRCIELGKNSIYYKAMVLLHGKRIANGKLNECYEEARRK
jgi:hypothetical protein